MNPQATRYLWIAAGALAANVVGAALCLVLSIPSFLPNWSSGRNSSVFWTVWAVIVWPNLILVPMAMGVVAAHVWRKLSLSLLESLLWWTITSLLLPLGAFLVWREGAVCCLI